MNKTLLTTFALGLTTTLLFAQGQRPPQQGGQGGNRPSAGGGQGGQSGQGMQRPPMPLMEALDANRDRTIDATEIANASAALKKLDKNGDGKLTEDEFGPRRPSSGGSQGGNPPGGGQNNQGQQQRQRPKSE